MYINALQHNYIGHYWLALINDELIQLNTTKDLHNTLIDIALGLGGVIDGIIDGNWKLIRGNGNSTVIVGGYEIQYQTNILITY